MVIETIFSGAVSFIYVLYVVKIVCDEVKYVVWVVINIGGDRIFFYIYEVGDFRDCMWVVYIDVVKFCIIVGEGCGL